MTCWASPRAWTARQLNAIRPWGLLVIEAALLGSGHGPRQHFEDVADFKTYFAAQGTILIDATEQRTQRPMDADYQKVIGPPMRYSGKKSTHGEDIDFC